MPRPLPAVNLRPSERDALEKWAGRRKTAQGLAMRARILLLADEGASNEAIAADLALDPATVGKWRNRFLRDRVEGLCDQPRSGAPRRIDDARVEALVLDTRERRPEGATHWSSRLIAKRHGLSHTSVQRIWLGVKNAMRLMRMSRGTGAVSRTMEVSYWRNHRFRDAWG